jgi:gas vesicle protein
MGFLASLLKRFFRRGVATEPGVRTRVHPNTQARRTAVRTSGVLVLGAVVGAAVVWLWGREMKEYVDEKIRGVRTKAAEGVGAVEETAERMLDRGDDALRRADEFLQDTREHVSEVLRAGQEAIRPAPAARKA